MFKKSAKTYVLVLSLCYNLLLFKFIAYQFPILGVAAITEQQRQEIQRLKSELSEALDEDNSNVAAKGVIVQPSWTQDKSTKTESVKVVTNAQNRKETADLRAEIQKAVAKDNYATVGAAKAQDIKSLETSLKSRGKAKQALLATLGQQGETTTPEDEQLGAGFGNEDATGNPKTPNVITANLADDSEIDVRKLQRLEVSKRRTREVLILEYIEEDFAFDLGAEVNEWKHIVHAGQEYFIGRRVTDLLIVRKAADKYERDMVVDIGQTIAYLETYTFWNLEQEHQEGVILIAAGDKVLWYRANQKSQQIELYWEWVAGYTITGLTQFSLDSDNYLAISSNQSFLSGHYALNIYQYKLEGKEFWIAQRLQLEFSCEEVTVLNTGRDVILAVPQNHTAKIYTFNPHEATFSHIRFQFKKSVPAEGISTIAGFKMGGHNYLALTGYQPQILLYEHGDFIPRTFFGNNFGLVDLFFPIPVRTYRDDLILLVQHRVEFTTHALTVVETLIWDGESFETSIPVPCRLGKHVVYGVGCMLDLHRDEGLKGAALLKRGDEIAVVVPRHKAESGLFRFHTKLLAKNSELLDLQEIFDFLKDWVKEQDDLISEAEAFLQIPNEQLINYQADFTTIESLTAPELEFNGTVGEIYVNDYLWTTEDSDMDLQLIIQNLEDLEKSLNSGRQRRNLDNILQDELDFDVVTVEELEVGKVNGQQFFIQNGELYFDGLINFSELEVFENVMDLRKRQLNDNDFVLDADLEFDQINGIDWSDIKNNLVFRTEKQTLKDLEVKGDVFVENLLNINTLNGLNFPDDYLLSNGPATSTVTAAKHFANILSVSSIDTNGTINGKNPADAITLADDQEWRGMPTFKQLEVANIWEPSDPEGSDRERSTFPQNPTLQESNIIKANCHFNELVVNGPLVLKGKMDGEPLGPLFKDIILRPENPAKEILVPSLKSFDSVSFPLDLKLENNTINEIPVQNFVTLHTNQTLNITSLEGYVYFYNLTLNGAYDGVKIEDILKKVILLDQPVDLSTTELIFSEKLEATTVSILDTINKQPIKDNLQTLKEDLHVKAAEFERLFAQQADFSNDLVGQGKLNNVELHNFISDKSWHEPPIKGNIFLNELILEQGIQADELHGIGAEYLLEFLNQIDELPDMVLNGQIQIDHITVTGDVQLYKLNGLLFDEEIQLTAIKLKHPNYLSNNLSFKNRLNIKGHFNVLGDFRGNNLPDLIEDMVFRTENSCINISAPKSFLKPVEVLQNTDIKALNGVSMENLAWTAKHNNFQGSVNIKGNLIVQDISVQGYINNFNWQDMHSLVYFDEKLQNFVLKNIIEFRTPQFLEDLTVMGDLNDVANLTDFFGNLIYKNQICLLKGKNTFTGRVSIDKGAYIKNLNGQDLLDLFNNLVFIHELQPVLIQTPVIFEDTIKANAIQVRESLNVEHLSGCSLSEWLNNSLRVDKDENISHLLQFAAGSLDGNSLSVNFINDKDLSRIITLSTPQTFNETVKFSSVILNGFISSKGLVNNVDLEKEFNNTLMTYGQQHIYTPLTVQSITVLGELQVHGLVNDNKDLKDVATLEEDLVFESPLYFQSLSSPKVIFKDLVTGIDFNKWFEAAVKQEYPGYQYITGNWSAKLLTVTTGPLDYQFKINGFEPWQYNSYIRLVRNENAEIYKDKEICQLVKQIWQRINKKPAFVKYIEEHFDMDLGKELANTNETLSKAFYAKSNEEHFLLVNVKCETFIYKWLAEENKFIFKKSFDSGPIDDIEVITAKNNSQTLQFITNFSTSQEEIDCSLKPLKKWHIENESLVLATDLPDASALLYKDEGANASLWTLQNETIQEMDLDYKIKKEWQLPVEHNKPRYRFVPLKEEHEILLTNGEQLVLISNHLEKKSPKSFLNDPDPQILQTSNFENLQDSNFQSLLKPNTSIANSLVFDRVEQVIERILTDLRQRLNQQIDVTQLSIPESDLFDEHLIPDFLAIMEELQKQTIYGSEVFNISFDNIKIPENPSQVLAARIVQTSWPVAVEIEEIHSFLKSNESHDHPLCYNITKSLGFLINDVVLKANTGNSSKPAEDLNLTKVIKRITEFEEVLNKFLTALKRHDDNDKPENKNFENDPLQTSASNREISLSTHTQDDLIFVENSFLPGYKQGEILSLLVGSTSRPHHLWAVTNTRLSLAGNNNPGIYLYLESLKGQLYQVISAMQPRSLQQLRIKQETLLMYIQGCCQIQILKYRGLQGFTPFAEISRPEHIQQILTISLPTTQGNFKHWLALLLGKNVKFYEFIIEGYDSEALSASNVIPLDCL